MNHTLIDTVRSAEQQAEAQGHVGLLITMTLPKRFHSRAEGCETPRDGQLWLHNTWQGVKAELGRRGVRMYGFCLAEPHRDGTPHWHLMLWAENEFSVQTIEAASRYRCRSFDQKTREIERNVSVRRMPNGRAAAYIEKYIAKAQEGDQQARLKAWADMWGIPQFKTIGMASVGAQQTGAAQS